MFKETLMPLNTAKNTLGLSIKAKANKAEILIYGAIGASWFEDSITAKQFSDELKALGENIKEIEVRINSPGGDVFEGWAIHARLKQHPAKVTVYVDGIAASIASIIALAGDKVIMAEGSQMMIHSAWTMAAGNARDFDKVVDRLLTIDDQLISAYVKKTKKSRSEIKDLVEAETWFTAEQAVEAGLADEIFSEAMPIAASSLTKATWLKATPSNVKTVEAKAREDIKNLKLKIEDFLTRNQRSTSK